MPSATSPNPHAAPPDELDALFDSDVGLEDVRRSIATNTTIDGPLQAKQLDTSNLDEEVVITKKRAPIAKLDEERILSAKGIPRLKRIAKKARYRGKGHEFSDMSKLLNMYQLWLDELYPRAKFADGLAMIEKLGHKKRIQMMRKEWIDEGKTRSDDPADTNAQDDGPGHTAEEPENTSIETRTDGETLTSSPAQRQPAPTEAEPDMDELDALLAEEQNTSAVAGLDGQTDDFADAEEAMAGMDW